MIRASSRLPSTLSLGAIARDASAHATFGSQGAASGNKQRSRGRLGGKVSSKASAMRGGACAREAESPYAALGSRARPAADRPCCNRQTPHAEPRQQGATTAGAMVASRLYRPPTKLRRPSTELAGRSGEAPGSRPDGYERRYIQGTEMKGRAHRCERIDASRERATVRPPRECNGSAAGQRASLQCELNNSAASLRQHSIA